MRMRHGLAALVLLSLTVSSRGASPAHDDASDAAYADGWKDGSNGGSGFAPWKLEAPSNPHWDSAFFAAPEGWGIAANYGDTFSAYRELLPGGPDGTGNLAAGQSITLNLRSNSISRRKGAVGVAFLDSQRNERLNLVCREDQNYMVHDDSGDHEINLAYTKNPLKITLTQRGNHLFTLAIEPEGEPAVDYSGSNAGGFAVLRFWNYTAGEKNGSSVYFDHLQVAGAR